MKWHWILLLVGLGIYGLIISPTLLHDTTDLVVLLMSGITVLSFAIFGLGSEQTSRTFAVWMIIAAILLAAVGILLVRDGRIFMLVLFIPAIALGGFGLQKYFQNRK